MPGEESFKSALMMMVMMMMMMQFIKVPFLNADQAVHHPPPRSGSSGSAKRSRDKSFSRRLLADIFSPREF